MVRSTSISGRLKNFLRPNHHLPQPFGQSVRPVFAGLRDTSSQGDWRITFSAVFTRSVAVQISDQELHESQTDMSAGALYQPLEPNTGFRILVLHPASNFEDDIVCSLIHTTIGEDLPYEALSYVWGTGAERRTVIVTDHAVQVTVNLERILRYLRHSSTPRNLWIDALCINQSNVQERNNHVHYMTDVYANCTTDLLWLGENDAIIRDGRKVIDHFGTLMNLDEKFLEWLDSPMYEQLHALFTNPSAWSRVWIMQEVAFARHVQLVAGNTTMPWDEIEAFFDTDRYIKRFGVLDAFHGPFSHELSIRSEGLEYPHILAQQRRTIQGNVRTEPEKSSPIDVLSRYRFTKATDPRDKIIALLGLISGELEVDIDYATPVHELYTRVATRLIEIDGNLDLLCQGPWQLYGRDAGIEGLPAWVPDFSLPGKSRIVFAQRDIFNAPGQGSHFNFSVSPKGRLAVKGYFLDQLSVIKSESQKAFAQMEKRGRPDVPSWHYARLAMFWLPQIHRTEGVEQGNIELNKFPADEASDAVAKNASVYPATYETYWRTLMMDCMQYPNRRIDPAKDLGTLRKTFADFLQLPLDKEARKDNDRAIEFLVDRNCRKSVFAICKQGYYCMVPPGAQANDKIVILNGAKTPIVLRPTLDGAFTWVGACYVHDFMDGQIMDTSLSSQGEVTFEIV